MEQQAVLNDLLALWSNNAEKLPIDELVKDRDALQAAIAGAATDEQRAHLLDIADELQQMAEVGVEAPELEPWRDGHRARAAALRSVAGEPR